MNRELEALQFQDAINRRMFLKRTGAGMGLAALGSIVAKASQLSPAPAAATPSAVSSKRDPLAGLPDFPQFAPKAKRVIYLFMAGAPSQLDLFDYKPQLQQYRGQNLPASVRMGQRLTGMTSHQAAFPVAPSIFKFSRHGKSGLYVSELLPHIGSLADDICVIKSTYTQEINHDPAVTMVQTGFQLAGRPAMGSWVAYGLGSENEDLPAYVVLMSKGRGQLQPIEVSQWGSGFMPTVYSGIEFETTGDPVPFLKNPAGVSRSLRQSMLKEIDRLNVNFQARTDDPEISTRVTQYELAFRMQASVPELLDTAGESADTLAMYGPNVTKPGTYAHNCLLARRLAERDVRFIQLFHEGWDQHSNLPQQIGWQCEDVDQPTAALVRDLKQRGLLDDTLVIWGGEFGRTVYSQGVLTATNYGRDHHPRCFTTWMAGGGIRGGITIGETDDYCYNIVRDPHHLHDIHATMLYLMGINHKDFTYKYQGRYYRLTDVAGNLISNALA